MAKKLDVVAQWDVIRAWLEAHQPERLAGFRKGASNADIASAEAKLGAKLPEDYRRFLQIHDGQRPNEPMVWTCSLFSVRKLAAERADYMSIVDEEPNDGDVAPQIKPVSVSPRWIPIGRSARGRDMMCLDIPPRL